MLGSGAENVAPTPGSEAAPSKAPRKALACLTEAQKAMIEEKRQAALRLKRRREAEREAAARGGLRRPPPSGPRRDTTLPLPPNVPPQSRQLLHSSMGSNGVDGIDWNAIGVKKIVQNASALRHPQCSREMTTSSSSSLPLSVPPQQAFGKPLHKPPSSFHQSQDERKADRKDESKDGGAMSDSVIDWETLDVDKMIADAARSKSKGLPAARPAPLVTPWTLSQSPRKKILPYSVAPMKAAAPPPPPPPPRPRIVTKIKQDEKDNLFPALMGNSNLKQPLKNGWNLFEHQVFAVEQAIKARRLILAYEMGLGKTVIACIVAKAFRKTLTKCRAVVIAPKSLKDEWLITANEKVGEVGHFELHNWGATLPSPEELLKKIESTEALASNKKGRVQAKLSAKAKMKKKKLITIESDSDSDAVAESSNSACSGGGSLSKGESSSASGRGDGDDDEQPKFFLICDEAHKIQSMETKQTKSVLKLALHKSCVGCLLLTGTPMKNGKPCNLFPLLRAIRHPLGNNQRKFEVDYCDGHHKFFGRTKKVWDASVRKRSTAFFT